jgi:hypothetical protein
MVQLKYFRTAFLIDGFSVTVPFQLMLLPCWVSVTAVTSQIKIECLFKKKKKTNLDNTLSKDFFVQFAYVTRLDNLLCKPKKQTKNYTW